MANSDGPRKIEISQKNKVFTLYIYNTICTIFIKTILGHYIEDNL